MSPGKPLTPEYGKGRGHEKVQAQALRKLKLLLQRWWQKHHQETDFGRESFLHCALIFGAAHYLSQINQDNQSDAASHATFASCVATVQELWPLALTGAGAVRFSRLQSGSRDLVGDGALQKDFLALAKQPPVLEIFCSPLCPSSIYEAFSFRERRRSKDLLQDDRLLLDSHHLISFTQVYTPAWVVDHLLKITLAPALTERRDLAALSRTTLLDPALGGGIFLVQALDSFMAAYQNLGLSAAQAAKHSLSKNLFALDIDPAALATAALAIILKAFSLGLSRAQVKDLLPIPNLCLIEEDTGPDEGSKSGNQFPLGSLCKDLRNIHGHILNGRYDVVVANPPYLGRKLLPRPLKEKLRRHYPDSASDLSQAFLSMALDMAKPGGRVGFITQGSILHLASARSLRERLLRDHQIIQVVELGAGVFPFLAGEKASTALIIIRNSMPASDQEGHFLSLVAEADKPAALTGSLPPGGKALLEKMAGIETVRRQSDFLKDQDGVINYMRPPVVMNLRSRLPKLADIATLKQGLATTNNARFLRYIWEVNPAEIGRRFVPYARGEGMERWWSPLTTLVLWENNGQAIKEAVQSAYPYLNGNYAWVVKNEDYYFRSGLTFSFVSKDRLAVRKLAAGAIFDVGSSAIFLQDGTQESCLLAYLNSSLATAMAHDLNPTINFQVGDLKKLVVPNFDQAEAEKLGGLAASCVAAKEKLFALSSAQRFFQPVRKPGENTSRPLPAEVLPVTECTFNLARAEYAEAEAKLGACEQEIDRLVMLAITRDRSLDDAERKAIQNFAHRPKLKTPSNLSGEKYCSAGLIEAMLSYFYGGDWQGSDYRAGRPRAVIASLKSEADADSFVNFWPGKFDLPFTRAQLSQGKGLAHYLREWLYQAFEDQFIGQPPLLVIKADPQTIVIIPAHFASDTFIVDRCGELSEDSAKRASDLLQQAQKITGAGQLRAKDILKEIARIKTLSAEAY